MEAQTACPQHSEPWLCFSFSPDSFQHGSKFPSHARYRLAFMQLVHSLVDRGRWGHGWRHCGRRRRHRGWGRPRRDPFGSRNEFLVHRALVLEVFDHLEVDALLFHDLKPRWSRSVSVMLVRQQIHAASDTCGIDAQNVSKSNKTNNA
jgi:hypothetical protein